MSDFWLWITVTTVWLVKQDDYAFIMSYDTTGIELIIINVEVSNVNRCILISFTYSSWHFVHISIKRWKATRRLQYRSAVDIFILIKSIFRPEIFIRQVMFSYNVVTLAMLILMLHILSKRVFLHILYRTTLVTMKQPFWTWCSYEHVWFFNRDYISHAFYIILSMSK